MNRDTFFQNTKALFKIGDFTNALVNIQHDFVSYSKSTLWANGDDFGSQYLWLEEDEDKLFVVEELELEFWQDEAEIVRYPVMRTVKGRYGDTGYVVERDISSKYWYTNEGVYRYSAHWGQVANCLWQLEGIRLNPDDSDEFVIGFCRWEGFTPNNIDTHF